MKSSPAVAALSALAQESRLAIFRALVQAGPEGLCPGALAKKLGVAAPTLSFHLAQLRHAGLIHSARQGRSLSYAANFAAMNALIGFLTEKCCGSDPRACGIAVCRPAAETPRRAARRSAA
jgi:ArsR family transcriptional regulator, arsenate/arsenite/antimonite-responsive transcriptional repressor